MISMCLTSSFTRAGAGIGSPGARRRTAAKSLNVASLGGFVSIAQDVATLGEVHVSENLGIRHKSHVCSYLKNLGLFEHSSKNMHKNCERSLISILIRLFSDGSRHQSPQTGYTNVARVNQSKSIKF